MGNRSSQTSRQPARVHCRHQLYRGRHITYTITDTSGGQSTAEVSVYSNGAPNGLAFPTAEGFGAFATGGIFGDVYVVTKSTDHATNPESGSLRYALLNAPQAGRIIVFNLDVGQGNTIHLVDELNIPNNITIAGETAKDPGITISGFQVQIFSSNVIIRHVRIRNDDHLGDRDALAIDNADTVMIDHCSLSWGTDGVIDVTNTVNATVQWCIISEGLMTFIGEQEPYEKHSTGSLITNDNLPSTRATVTMHHNLFAHNRYRNGGQASGNTDFDFVNNVIYNWGRSLKNRGDGKAERGFALWIGDEFEPAGKITKANVVNNYFKEGPNSIVFSTTEMQSFSFVSMSTAQTWLDGNVLDRTIYGTGGLTWLIEQNTAAADPVFNTPNDGSQFTEQNGFFDDSSGLLTGGRFPFPVVSTDSVGTAYNRVIAEAGAYLTRSVEPTGTDNRIIWEVQNDGGWLRYAPPESP